MIRNMNRRKFIKYTTGVTLAGGLGSLAAYRASRARDPRPNFLILNSDDQSWAHTGIEGCEAIKTPHFDRIAREGVYFPNAFCSSPSCTPSRAALLTGRNFWELEKGADLRGPLASKFEVYPDLLEAAGYRVGCGVKGWGPGSIQNTGRTRNPAGPDLSLRKLLLQRQLSLNPSQPFCYWFGSLNPHRPYGETPPVDPAKVTVPPFLPDVPQVRNDMANYLGEVERFDHEIGYLLGLLQNAGELDHTVVIVTSDNGMPFPRAKTNLYDHGTRVPLAIRWPEFIAPNRRVTDFVNQIDIAPTLLELAGMNPTAAMTGRSLLTTLNDARSGQIQRDRNFVVTGRETHGHLYPMRAIRTEHFLYIRNFEPDRWPSLIKSTDPSPTRESLTPTPGSAPGNTPGSTTASTHTTDARRCFELAFGRRPLEELYDLKKDPHQINNIASEATYQAIKEQLQNKMIAHLIATKDPRIVGS